MKQKAWKRVVMVVVVEKWKGRKLYVYVVVVNDYVSEGHKFATVFVVWRLWIFTWWLGGSKKKRGFG